jgi:hypothetical protein
MKKTSFCFIILIFFITGFSSKSPNRQDVNNGLTKEIKRLYTKANNVKVLAIKELNGYNIVLFSYKLINNDYIGCDYFTSANNTIKLKNLGYSNKIRKDDIINDYSIGLYNNNPKYPLVLYGVVTDKRVKFIEVHYSDEKNISYEINNNFCIAQNSSTSSQPIKYYALDIKKRIIAEKPISFINISINDIEYSKITIKNHGGALPGHYDLSFDIKKPDQRYLVNNIIDWLALSDNSLKDEAVGVLRAGGDVDYHLVIKLKNGKLIDIIKGRNELYIENKIIIQTNYLSGTLTAISPELKDFINRNSQNQNGYKLIN